MKLSQYMAAWWRTLALLLAASRASALLRGPGAARRIALRGGARPPQQPEQQLQPRAAPLPPGGAPPPARFANAYTASETNFLAMAAVALVDVLLNIVRPERVTGYGLMYRLPRCVWNFAIVALCVWAQAEHDPETVFLIAAMAAITGLSDLLVWCPIYTFSMPDSWERCTGGFLFSARTCTPIDELEMYWKMWMVVESIGSGLFWMWAAIHAKGRFTYLRDEQKVARARAMRI